MAAHDALLILEGVRGESAAVQRGRHYPTLAALLMALRGGDGGYVLTAVAHGAPSSGARRALLELRRWGALERPATGVPAWPLLLILPDPVPLALLLPAVQKMRAAAERLDLPASLPVVAAVTGSGGRAGGWVEVSGLMAAQGALP